MNENNLEQNIKNTVLEKIRSGRLHMHPRAYFVVRFALTIFVALLVLLISAFVISFVFFSIHESGEQFLLGFGSKGILTFLLLFPWLSLCIDIALLVLLKRLLQGFKFSYRSSHLMIFLGIIACSTVLGVVITLTPLHRLILDAADRGTVPILCETYERIRDSHADRNVFRGTVASIQDNTIVITHNDADHDDDDGTRMVLLPSVHIPLSIGDRVYVFGMIEGGEVKATGIRKLSPDQ